MRLALLPLLCAIALPAAADENLMLVLDASGSMWGQIDGRSKVEIARETVAGVLQDWRPEHALGLVAYGHRRKGDCADIETLIPVGPLDAASYLKTVNGLNALGMTPISAAVQHAAAALKSSEQKATVILVSDGEETCKLDPCAVGAALEQQGIDFTAHVIGFDVSQPQHQAQLRCLAENTGGRYFNARDALELGAALDGALSASVEPAPPPATATVAAEADVAAAEPLTVRWRGPADRSDFIAIAATGSGDGEYLNYTMLEVQPGGGEGTVSLATPAKAGTYELRYVSPVRTDAVLARAAVTLGEVEASLDAPDSVVAGAPVMVRARGPAGPRHWIGFASTGSASGSYLAYARPTGVESEVELMPPSEPGDYELRYVLNEGERVLASRPVRVTAPGASVSGPARVMAGAAVTVEASGPAGDNHWIGFAPAGSDAGAYEDYARPQGTSSTLTLAAPDEPGEYELRYVLNESEKVIASQPVTVTAAVATLEARSSVAPATELQVGFSGPLGDGGAWIGFVPRGGDGDQYFGYFSLGADVASPQTLASPEEPGDYDLIYFATSRVLVRHPVSVR